MSDSAPRKLSRRKLIGGAAGTAAAIPLLHETVPHQMVHDQLARAAGGGHAAGHEARGRAKATHRGADHSGAVGRVDPAANGFDPHELLRDFYRGTVTREGGRTVRTFEIQAEDKE